MEEDMILKQFFHYRGKAQARSTVKDMVVLVKSVTKAEPAHANVKKEYEPHDKSEKETINLEKIHFHIKNDTPSGRKIKEEFGKTFPAIKVFDETVVTGGNRKTHHDFGLKWLFEERKKMVEFKGSEKKKPIDAQGVSGASIALIATSWK